MPSKLPFNKATIAGVTVDVDEFVSGSGSVTLSGEDSNVTTADSRIHNDRLVSHWEGSFEVYGDRTDLDSGAGLGNAVALFLDDTEIHSGTGIVTAEYNDENKTTSISINGDPE